MTLGLWRRLHCNLLFAINRQGQKLIYFFFCRASRVSYSQSLVSCHEHRLLPVTGITRPHQHPQAALQSVKGGHPTATRHLLQTTFVTAAVPPTTTTTTTAVSGGG